MRTDLMIAVGAIGLVLIILNVVFLGIIFFTRRKMDAVSKWPTTLGTVQNSILETRHSSESGSVDYPMVRYSYQVAGQTYQGNRIAPGMEVGGSGAGKVVARYPAGAQVMVFYNPQKPSEAVLETKAPAQFWIWFILITFDVVLCGIIPVIVWALSQ